MPSKKNGKTKTTPAVVSASSSAATETTAATTASLSSSSLLSAAKGEQLPPPPTTAPPPWHTSALIFMLLAIFTTMLPSRESMDEISNKEVLLHVNFPDILSIRHVACLRLLFGSVMIFDSLYAVLWGKWEQDTDYYYPYSTLKVVRGMPFRGFMYSGSVTSGLLTLSSFTMWAWTLEGFTFMLLGGIPLYLDMMEPSREGAEVSVWWYRVAMIGWEICAPTSLLVSSIVTYVLWPMALQQGENNAKLLKHPGAMLEHNFNVLTCLTEVALLGGLPIRYQDFVYAPLFGLVYVFFTYAMMHSWAAPECGPQFMYPFFDTTMGWLTTFCLVALLGVLTVSFGIFCWLDHFITETLQGGIMSHVAAVMVIGVAVCRFRD